MVWTGMWGHMLAGLEDKNHYGNQRGDFLADAPCFWTQAGVFIGAQAIAGQYEALPLAIIADRRCVGGKLVEGGHFLFSRRARAGVGHGLSATRTRSRRVHGKMVLS